MSAPRPSNRLARVCTKCGWRSFGQADAKCPEHGGHATVTQENGKYLGKKVR